MTCISYEPSSDCRFTLVLTMLAEYKNMNSTGQRTRGTEEAGSGAVLTSEGLAPQASDILFQTVCTQGGRLPARQGEPSEYKGFSWQRAGPADCTAAAQRQARRLPVRSPVPCSATQVLY